MFTQQQKVEVEYGALQRLTPNQHKHGFVKIRIPVALIDPDTPEVSLVKSQIAVASLYNVRPQPVGDFFSVIWNGDAQEPKLRFDNWPTEGSVEIMVEYWGR